MEASAKSTERQTISMQEAADLLGVHRQTIKRRVASGEIPSFKVGNRRLIPLALLDQWVEAQIEQGQTDGRP